jgi:hypothetical protein
MSEINHRELLVDIVREGTINVARDYYLRLADEDSADVDDLRKALEIGAKVMGALQPEKTDNLLQVSWTINGGTVTIDAKQAPAPELEIVEDVTPKTVEVPTLEQAAAAAPVDPTSKFDVVDNLLDSL